MYKIILLDADQTIFDYHKSETHALKKSLENYSIKKNFELIQKEFKVINQMLWEKLENKEITKDELRTKRFEKLFKIFSLNVNPDIFSNVYLKNLSKCSFLLDGAEDLCQYLKTKYRLAIVTNGIKEIQLSRIKNSTIHPYIESTVVSDELGISKPDPLIFAYALKKLYSHDKKSVMMIGDSLTSDILGGNTFGIDTCWVNLSQESNSTKIKPTFAVNSLDEIKKIV